MIQLRERFPQTFFLVSLLALFLPTSFGRDVDILEQIERQQELFQIWTIYGSFTESPMFEESHQALSYLDESDMLHRNFEDRYGLDENRSVLRFLVNPGTREPVFQSTRTGERNSKVHVDFYHDALWYLKPQLCNQQLFERLKTSSDTRVHSIDGQTTFEVPPDQSKRLHELGIRLTIDTDGPPVISSLDAFTFVDGEELKLLTLRVEATQFVDGDSVRLPSHVRLVLFAVQDLFIAHLVSRRCYTGAEVFFDWKKSSLRSDTSLFDNVPGIGEIVPLSNGTTVSYFERELPMRRDASSTKEYSVGMVINILLIVLVACIAFWRKKRGHTVRH